VTDQPKPKSGRPRSSPFQLLAPIALGLVVGSALYAGYMYWAHHTAQQKALAAAPGDADMAKPAPEECAIARAALTAVHAAGADKAWRTHAAADEMSLATHSKVINPVDVPGYTDAEADDLRGKAAADWRWCPGMTAFVSGLGWSAMGSDDYMAALALGRPGLSKDGDEARLYEAFLAPKAEADGGLMLSSGPWVVTLHKGADGTWAVASTTPVARPRH
jgi:hypothetical protein